MTDIRETLKQLKNDFRLREIPDIESKYDGRIVVSGKEYINLASNDYLGISTKSDLRNEFLSYSNLPLSSASARLLTGSSPEYNILETTVAKMFNKEAALIFNTGYQANLGVISALCGRGDVVFSDKLNHASIIDGMKLSDGEFFRYKHLDYENLETLLKSKREKYNNAIIVSESVFSMDGDIADISKLIELKTKYNCLLMVDEAHAFCACGKGLNGITEGNDIDIITATFGKALGSFGAFCASNKEIISYLINKARSFIFSTSIPPLNIGWTNWLLNEKTDYIVTQKQKLEELTGNVHELLKSMNVITPSQSQIIPVMIGNNNKTLNISEKLRSMGYYIPAIRPPTVPEGTSRLRISLTADCNFEEIKKLFETVLSFLYELPNQY